MSFNLKTAALNIRKAAAIEGIRSGTWEPVFDPNGGPGAVIAKVSNGRKEIEIRRWQADYADSKTWSEI